jgi:hypothetical protein
MTRRQRIDDAHQLARLIPATRSASARLALIRSVLMGLRVALARGV